MEEEMEMEPGCNPNPNRNVTLTLSLSPLVKELYFLIAKFLEGGPCKEASESLIQELEKHEILPKSVNWLGEQIPQDFKTFSSKYGHINSEHLPKLLEQFLKTVNAKDSSTSRIAQRSLLSFSTLSRVNNKTEDEKSSGKKTLFALSLCKRNSYHALLRAKHLQNYTGKPFNQARAIFDRPLNGLGFGHDVPEPDFCSRMKISCNTLGHLAAVYCVLFDMSGRYVFTGADDHLVKVWSTVDGRLIYTFRGTSSEVVDLAVNYENTMLAVASCDKVIRVWCLTTGQTIATLAGQGGNSTSIFFCPTPRSRSVLRYLVSTSTDGSCAFWGYMDDPGEPVQFLPSPTLYLERMRPGNATMICSSFSAGGMCLAAGSADNHVRVYQMLTDEGPTRIVEVSYHTDRVDSISWAHEGLRFVSGSKDGTALIWRFEDSCWRYIRLLCTRNFGETPVIYDDPKRRPKVTMVGWNQDDSLVLTAVSDFMIRVWDSRTGELIRVLKEHSGEVFVIEAHPTNPKLVCTAGHDGKLIIWDVGTTNKADKAGKVFQYYNDLGDGQGHGCLFDAKWSPDGFSIAVTDSHGHFMLFTVEGDKNTRYAKLPKEMFFHTDYRPLTTDAITGEVLDEQTQVAPHAMPPPFLVDVDGNPYPADLQRLVPGRENFKEEYLIPQVAVSERGYQEVIEGLPNPNNPNPNLPRSNIDEMIHQLAIEQGFEGRQRQAGGGDHRGVGNRRSGEVEGVRQSRGNWQNVNDSSLKPKQRRIVPPLQDGMMAASEAKRLGLVEFEEKYFAEHKDRYSSAEKQNIGVAGSAGISNESPEGRSRRLRRLAAHAAEQRQRQEEQHAALEEREGVARPNPRPQPEISRTVERRRAVRPPPLQNDRNVSGIRRNRAVRYDVARIIRANGSDIENVDFNTSSSEASVDTSESSESESSSEDDWGGNLGAGRRRREQENAQSRDNKGRGGKRRGSHSSNEEEEGSGEETPVQKKKTVKVKKEPEENMDADSSEPRPGPSSEIANARGKSEPGSVVKRSRPRKSKGKVDYTGGFEDIPPLYRPSEWLADFVPHKSPYFPQVGDDLVYFRQGHEKYIKMVEDNKIYEIPKKMKKSLPYIVRPDLDPELSVRVVAVRFEIEPPRVVVLKLARTDWETGELIRNGHDILYVKYHDVPNVVDFLILRQMYNKSIRRKWNPGDRFRCLIGREWWLGTVQKLESTPEYQDSHFLCYKTLWDSGEIEMMSPWDMETIPDDFVPPPDHDPQVGIPASEEDSRFGIYEPSVTDWPPHGHQDAQCQKLSALLDHVMELAFAEAFLVPVDLNRYPDYAQIIEYPMDLTTIKERLNNRFYRRVDAVKWDLSYIALNAEKFNVPGSEIVRHAKVIRDVCNELLGNPDMPATSVNQIYQRISKNMAKTTPSAESQEHRKPVKAAKGPRAERDAHPSSSKKSQRIDEPEESEEDDRDWRQQCLDLVNEIYHKRDAAPFRSPVDITEYPEYYQVIDTPMDLQSIREDLLGQNYRNAQDFHKDMMLIFANSKQFNTERSQIYAMTCRLQSMYECKIKSIMKHRRGKRRIHKIGRRESISRHSKGPSSATSTPRKNPRRAATDSNRYINHSGDESLEDEEDESIRDSAATALRTRAHTYGTRRSSIMNGHGYRLGGSSTDQRDRISRVNGHGTRSLNATPNRSSTSSSRISTDTSAGSVAARPVKRLRIMSSGEGEGDQSPRRGTRAPRTEEPATRASPRKHRIIIKDEQEEESDEESVGMPRLDRGDDEDFQLSEDDDESDEGRRIRRSGRVKSSRVNIDEHAYETRNRGRPIRSYAEAEDGSDEDESRYGKRRRVVHDAFPARATRQQEGSQSHSQPPVLRRVGRILSDEEHDEGANEPGPSSRLLRQTRNQPQAAKRSTKEEEDEEDEEEYTENETESEEESEEEEEDEEGRGGKGKKTSQRQSRPQRKPLRQKQNVSDDDDVDADTKRSSKTQSHSTRRQTRGHRPHYAEDDSDSDHPTITTVSSRGRVRKTKAYLAD